MIQEITEKAISDSKVFGICYILSNGEDLQLAITAGRKDKLKENGYWVAAIYERGYKMDL